MPTDDIAEFKQWLLTVQPHDLMRWIMDAYWKGQLKDSELERAYLLSQKGVDMRTHPA